MIAVFLLLIFSGCHISRQNDVLEDIIPGTGNLYASGFSIIEHQGYRVIEVNNPWQGANKISFKYILVDKDSDIPDDIPDGLVIRTPVKKVIPLSTTHVAMIDFLGETDKIIAVAGGRYIYNSEISRRANSGELNDIGYDTNLNYELIVSLKPDVVFAYGVGAEASAYISRLKSLGINVVLIGEYLEHSPLAQCEWVRFMSHFFNKQDFADYEFKRIDSSYTHLLDLVDTLTGSPIVMTGLPWRESWFVPGGRSLFAKYISDAGGSYIFSENRGRDNFPVDMETILTTGNRADFWINTGTAKSLDDIYATDSRLVSLSPYKNIKVFNNNARLNSNGGNDFWESGIVNPHHVLNDLINILHPGITGSDSLVYYRKLHLK